TRFSRDWSSNVCSSDLALGRRCPVPVIELAKVIGDVPVGGTVRVLSDDEAARLDIPAWCEMRGQEYVGEEPAERGSAHVVRRLRSEERRVGKGCRSLRS